MHEGVIQLCCCEQCMSVSGFWSAHRMIVSISPILVLESSMRLTIEGYRRKRGALDGVSWV